MWYYLSLNLLEEYESNFFLGLIFLDCSVEICIKRDYKGHYQKAISGKLNNFIGISEPYEVSDKYDLILDAHQNSNSFTTDDVDQIILYTCLYFC